MALRYYIYGEVFFSTTQKRAAAGRRLDNFASRAGFTATVWPQLVEQFGAWPAGRQDITTDGVPGIRLCYSTLDPAVAEEAIADIAAAWDVFSDSNSWWGYVVQPE